MKKLFYCLPGVLFSSLVLTSCSKEGEPGGHAFERPLPVAVAEVSQRDVPVYIEAIGNVEAYKSVSVRPRVGGAVMKVAIDGGDTVKTGDLLYEIDSIPYQIALEKAEATLVKDEAELEYGRKKLERYSGLVQKDYVAQINIEEYRKDVKIQEGQVRIDKAEIENAKINIDYCKVTSPIDGKVSLAKIDHGNIVQANDSNALITILQVKPIYINFALTQKDFQELQEVLHEGKRKFNVVLPFGCPKGFEGELDAYDNQVSAETATIQLKGTVSNDTECLWPGEFVKVKLFVKTKHQVPVIPSEAVQKGQKGIYVYVLKPDMTVENVPIKTGEIVDNLIVVDEGLKPGMKVITEGQLNLRSGAKVMIPGDATPAKSLEPTKPAEKVSSVDAKKDSKAGETKEKI